MMKAVWVGDSIFVVETMRNVGVSGSSLAFCSREMLVLLIAATAWLGARLRGIVRVGTAARVDWMMVVRGRRGDWLTMKTARAGDGDGVDGDLPSMSIPRNAPSSSLGGRLSLGGAAFLLLGKELSLESDFRMAGSPKSVSRGGGRLLRTIHARQKRNLPANLKYECQEFNTASKKQERQKLEQERVVTTLLFSFPSILGMRESML
jgi:hypothetical protein